MMVFNSRHTPGLANGEYVGFDVGDVVTYKLRSGQKVKITIKSGRMRHDDLPDGRTGYEALFHDDNQMGFAIAEKIIDWKGKC